MMWDHTWAIKYQAGSLSAALVMGPCCDYAGSMRY